MAEVRRINPTRFQDLQIYVRDIPKNIKRIGTRCVKWVAEDILFDLAREISEAADGDFDDYTEAYEKWKERNGEGIPNFWHLNYFLSTCLDIIHKDTGGDNMSYVVGFTDETVGRNSDISASHLASIVESRRPVVEPFWRDNKEHYKEKLREIYAKNWEKERRKYGG